MKYFLHDTHAFADEKITRLYMEFGYEGVGLFFTILERLAMQEKPVSEEVLKTQLYIKKRLEKQLKFMYKIGILSVKNGDVFNENLLNFSEKYQIKKQKTRERVAEWRAKPENVTRYKRVRNSPKVKESKVNIKESKKKHGEYRHVLLTPDQYEKLKKDYNGKLDGMIKKLDEGIQQHGYKYKDHNLTLRKWFPLENDSGTKLIPVDEYLRKIK